MSQKPKCREANLITEQLLLFLVLNPMTKFYQSQQIQKWQQKHDRSRMLTDNFQTSRKYETVIGLANGTIFVGIRET